MVSALNSGSSSPDSSPGQGHCDVFWARHLTLTAPLSTQVHKWVLANLMPGATLRWTSIPSCQGTVEIVLIASCHRERDNHRPVT